MQKTMLAKSWESRIWRYSLGMIVGSLLAGFLYDYGSKLPFLVGSFTAFIALIILIKEYKTKQKDISKS
ncbi:MAG: hypothetical protein V8T45_01390 [Oscillospiraceae bacterium]